MRHRGVPAAAGALIALALTVSARTQSASSPSFLAGTVVTDSNVPVPCARVWVQGAGAPLSMRTGADGRFAFSRIPFRVRAIGVDGSEGTLLDNKTFPDPANVALRSAPARLLAGILIDEHHQPIGNVEVTALSRQAQYGRLRFVPVANDVTEADGSYCIRVPVHEAGTEFLVGVIPTGTWLKHPGWTLNVADLAGYPPTYFPSVTTSAAAQVVSVSSDGERRNLNFALQTGQVTRIEGEVTGADRRTLGQSDVVLEPPDEDVAIHRRVTPDANGRFAFDDVPPGAYTIHLFPFDRLDGGARWGIAHVTVRENATVQVTLASQATLTFAGTVSFDGAPAMLPGVPLPVTVHAQRILDPANRFPSFYWGESSLSDVHGRFAVKNLVPGQYQLSVAGASVRGWRLASITVPQTTDDRTVEARDVTWTPLVVEPGRDMFNAKVDLVSQPAIAGVVRDENGKPIASRVLVFPVDERRSAIDDVESRPDGVFNVADVPPGDYLAIAVRVAPAVATLRPEVLATLRRLAIRITVGRAPATAQVTLTQVIWPIPGATRGALRLSKH